MITIDSIIKEYKTTIGEVRYRPEREDAFGDSQTIEVNNVESLSQFSLTVDELKLKCLTKENLQAVLKCNIIADTLSFKKCDLDDNLICALARKFKVKEITGKKNATSNELKKLQELEEILSENRKIESQIKSKIATKITCDSELPVNNVLKVLFSNLDTMTKMVNENESIDFIKITELKVTSQSIESIKNLFNCKHVKTIVIKECEFEEGTEAELIDLFQKGVVSKITFSKIKDVYSRFESALNDKGIKFESEKKDKIELVKV